MAENGNGKGVAFKATESGQSLAAADKVASFLPDAAAAAAAAAGAGGALGKSKTQVRGPAQHSCREALAALAAEAGAGC